jgi:hypothetical protein
MHTMCITITTTLGSTQGVLALSRDKCLNTPLIADWQAIASCHKNHVNENLLQQIGGDINTTVL